MHCIDISSYVYDINDPKRPLAQTGNHALRTLGVCTAVELKLYGVCRELKTTHPIQLCIHSICYLDILFVNQAKAYRQEERGRDTGPLTLDRRCAESAKQQMGPFD
jgi:hypothetical protein